MSKKGNVDKYFERLRDLNKEYDPLFLQNFNNQKLSGIYKNLETFTTYFERLFTEGNQDNFLIIEEDSEDSVYLQYLAGPDTGTELYMEAVSNEYLAERRKLTEEKIAILHELGFKLEPSVKNYYIKYDLSGFDYEKLALFSLKIFDEVYDSSKDAKFKFELRLYG